jgi:hypothetical protein
MRQSRDPGPFDECIPYAIPDRACRRVREDAVQPQDVVGFTSVASVYWSTRAL